MSTGSNSNSTMFSIILSLLFFGLVQDLEPGGSERIDLNQEEHWEERRPVGYSIRTRGGVTHISRDPAMSKDSPGIKKRVKIFFDRLREWFF